MAKKKGEKPGVMLYWETFATLERAKPEKVKVLLRAIYNFSRYGEVPDFGDDEALNLVWPQMEQRIIADGENYERIREKRAEAGRKGGLARASKAEREQANEANATNGKQNKPSTTTTTTTATSTATTTTDRESIADKPPRTRFSPPSVEEVREYCRERNNGVDPERFVDYYSSNGWMVGKHKMKDWKAAVRTWEGNGYQNKGREKKNGGKNIGDTQAEKPRLSNEVVY